MFTVTSEGLLMRLTILVFEKWLLRIFILFFIWILVYANVLFLFFFFNINLSSFIFFKLMNSLFFQFLHFQCVLHVMIHLLERTAACLVTASRLTLTLFRFTGSRWLIVNSDIFVFYWIQGFLPAFFLINFNFLNEPSAGNHRKICLTCLTTILAFLHVFTCKCGDQFDLRY